MWWRNKKLSLPILEILECLRREIREYRQECNCLLIKEVRENDRKARLLAINKYSIINDELKKLLLKHLIFI